MREEFDELVSCIHRCLFRSYDFLFGRFKPVAIYEGGQRYDERHNNSNDQNDISVREPHRFILLKLTKPGASDEIGHFGVIFSLTTRYLSKSVHPVALFVHNPSLRIPFKVHGYLFRTGKIKVNRTSFLFRFVVVLEQELHESD